MDKTGDPLPITTKYKRKDSNSIPVKFVVSKNLDVEAVEFKPNRGLDSSLSMIDFNLDRVSVEQSTPKDNINVTECLLDVTGEEASPAMKAGGSSCVGELFGSGSRGSEVKEPVAASTVSAVVSPAAGRSEGVRMGFISQTAFVENLEAKFEVRDLAKMFKNQSEKVIFMDGYSDNKSGPGEQHPNILVIKKDSFGEYEFEQIFVINLRIGEKIIFKDISLAEAVAGVIQMYFSFNLLYPPEADDLCQFMERILCNFGSPDGARNKKGVIKKSFRDFEVRFSF